MKIINKSGLTCLTVLGQLNYPNHSLSLVVKGSFDLSPDSEFSLSDDQGDMAADIYIPSEQDKGESLYYDSDATPFKPNADLIVHGRCYAPNKEPIKASKCSVSVDEFKHEVVVVGDRYVRNDGFGGRVVSDVEPFASMPLNYENAAATSFNPVGVEVGRGRGTKLPNIISESALNSQRIIDENESLLGFGPVHREWPNRKELLGSYSDDYLETRWPWYPKDFDFSYFNCAPPWMQLDGYLSGTESLTFTNMHPEHVEYKAQLPSLKLRCFNQLADGSWNELPMNLDTCWVDMDKEAGVLLWRGWMPVSNELYEEVKYIFVAAENVDEPKSADYWWQQFLDEVNRTNANNKNAQSVAADIPSRSLSAAQQSALEEDSNATAENLSFTEQLEQDAELKAFYDELPEEVQKELQEGRGEKDLPLQELVGSISELNPEQQSIVYQVSDAFEKGTAKETLLSLIDVPLDDALSAEIDRILKLSSSDELPLNQLENLPPEQLQVLEKLKADSEFSLKSSAEKHSEETLDESEAITNLLFGADGDKNSFNPRELEKLVREGVSFYDLDLSSLNLSSVDLSGGTFIRCSFVSSCLHKANLDQALLIESNMDHADLSYANLEGARLSSISASAANLSFANLTQADLSMALLFSANLQSIQANGARFVEAELGDVNFSDAHCDQSDFTRANLVSAVAYRTSLQGACFNEANIESAIFDYANLTDARFYKTEGQGVSLISSNTSGLRAAKARLPELRAQYLKGPDSNWIECDLVSADFLGAQLPQASFVQSKLTKSVLSYCDLYEANFSYAVLDEATLVDAKLVRARFERASIKHSDLSGSNAYAADFHLAEVEQVNAVDTNLEMTQYAG